MRNTILAVGLGGVLLPAGFIAGSLLRPQPSRYVITDCANFTTAAAQATFTKTVPGQGKEGIGVRCVRLDRETGRVILVASSRAKFYAPVSTLDSLLKAER